MKKLLLVLSIVVIGLSGCFVRAQHDDGYDRDHDNRRDDHKKHDGKY